MGKQSTISRTWTFNLLDGKAVTIEVLLHGSYDPAYGSDADGNRGIGVWFLDDSEYKIPELDDEQKPLTNLEMQAIENLVEAAIANDPLRDFGEGDDETPDYDDEF
jgi:hypothetical protein